MNERRERSPSPPSKLNQSTACLGLTHDGTKSRQGSWVLKRRTARKRLRRTLTALWQWCRHHRHTPLTVQYRLLCQKLGGHFQYDGCRGNYPRLVALFR
jgi:RNA-directed DNA polymerase